MARPFQAAMDISLIWPGMLHSGSAAAGILTAA